eukprot:6186996-Pleurochrysis_carterae.AAC.3
MAACLRGPPARRRGARAGRSEISCELAAAPSCAPCTRQSRRELRKRKRHHARYQLATATHE